jgi:hypothetical protein
MEIWATSTNYCPNQPQQQGGLDLSFGALGSNDVYVNSWTSNHGAFCDTNTDPVGCFGPENTPIDFEICATCSLGVLVMSDHYYCDPGYILHEGPPPYCEYHTCPPQMPPPCPNGFWYDPQNDVCQMIVMQTEDCPGGYQYNQITDCCEAVFAPPTEDPGPVPEAFYNVCPPGTGSIILIDEAIPQGQNYAICRYISGGGQMEQCIQRTFFLGDCRDEGCFNPSQYLGQAPCENNGCKWYKPPTGGPGSCIHP